MSFLWTFSIILNIFSIMQDVTEMRMHDYVVQSALKQEPGTEAGGGFLGCFFIGGFTCFAPFAMTVSGDESGLGLDRRAGVKLRLALCTLPERTVSVSLAILSVIVDSFELVFLVLVSVSLSVGGERGCASVLETDGGSA